MNNRISSLPSGIFDELASLRFLELNNNMITSLPENVFDQLSQLTVLRLNNNAIASLPLGIFNQQASLKRLYLQNNKIARLPEGIFDALPLHDLSLENNLISSLPLGIFDSMEPFALDPQDHDLNDYYHNPSNPSSHSWRDGEMRLRLGFNALEEVPFAIFQQQHEAATDLCQEQQIETWCHYPCPCVDIQSLAEGNTLPCLPDLPPNLQLDRQSSALAPCQCEAGTYLASWSQGCTFCRASCDAGQEACPRGSTEPNECRNCPPGTYGTSDYQCLPCGIGTYQSAEGQTACVSCPTDTTTTSMGSTSDSSCVCNAGYSVTADSDGMSSLLAGGGTEYINSAGSDAKFNVPR
jgi:Leucine-rich repeat (LRR) protein